MKRQTFPLSVVLAVYMDRPEVSLGDPEEFNGLRTFIVGGGSKSITPSNIAVRCQRHLTRQIQWVEHSAVQAAMGELRLKLNGVKEESRRADVVRGWVTKLTSGGYGIKLPAHVELSPIPETA